MKSSSPILASKVKCSGNVAGAITDLEPDSHIEQGGVVPRGPDIPGHAHLLLLDPILSSGQLPEIRTLPHHVPHSHLHELLLLLDGG